MTVKEQLEHLIEAIDGNGKEGLKSRMARIEEKLEAAVTVDNRAGQLLESNAEQLKRLTESVIKLEASVDAHHKTLHMVDVIKKKSNWVAFFVVLFVIDAVVRFIPEIWNFIAGIFGLPTIPPGI